MQTIIFHPDREICDALERMTRRIDDVTILCASYEELYESGIVLEGAVVSPGNGFGILDGGFDAVLYALHGAQLEYRIKRAILSLYGPELPVGACVAAKAPDEQLVIYAPTMQGPMRIDGTDNVYRAARASAHMAQRMGIGTLFMPLLGTGAGGMAVEDAAAQMIAGVHDGTEPMEPEKLDWAHADRMHQQWHRFCGVPDDGFRWALCFGRPAEKEDANAEMESQTDG